MFECFRVFCHADLILNRSRNQITYLIECVINKVTSNHALRLVLNLKSAPGPSGYILEAKITSSWHTSNCTNPTTRRTASGLSTTSYNHFLSRRTTMLKRTIFALSLAILALAAPPESPENVKLAGAHLFDSTEQDSLSSHTRIGRSNGDFGRCVDDCVDQYESYSDAQTCILQSCELPMADGS